jgi:hypothetical protein
MVMTERWFVEFLFKNDALQDLSVPAVLGRVCPHLGLIWRNLIMKAKPSTALNAV